MQAQRRTLETFGSRNLRLSHSLGRGSAKAVMVKVPLQFANKVELKAENVDKYVRAKSCLQLPQKTHKELRTENMLRFRELLELNRRQYGQDYIYNKRIEVSQTIHAHSCAASPRASTSSGPLVFDVYRASTLKQEYGVINTPAVARWQHASQQKLKRVPADSREHFLECRGFQPTSS
jgi:hypothetical protein